VLQIVNKGKKMKIVFFIVVSLFLVGCSEDTKKEVKKEVAKGIKQELRKEVKKENLKVKTPEVVIEVDAPKQEVVSEKLAKVLNGKKLYAACSGCHGFKGEKSALGKSKIIKGWNSSKVISALNGYKNETYGGSMKGLMRGQVLKLSEDEMDVIAKYISTLD
jgi:cytochrome c553